ncbi:MAG: hypothetical protein KAX50_06495 [Saprospiraceae bacterium]|nr:hypothetical protein [Saprospiraceae bacterium]
MKKPSDHIFQLIRAMTPSEKRYFRRHYAPEDGQLIHLFEVANHLETYDEEHLKSRLDPPVAKHLKVYKLQLHELLLKSLTSFHSKRGPLSKIRMCLEEADVLAEKQLFQQAFDRLSKARTLCEHYEEYTYLLEVSAREFYLKHVSNDRIGISKHPYFEETQKSIGCLNAGIEYYRDGTRWVEILAQYYYRGPSQEEMENAYALLKKEQLVDADALPFRAKLSRNSLLMSAYSLTENKEMEGYIRRDNLSLFEKWPQFQETMPFQYIGALRNLMNFCLSHGDFDQVRACAETGLAFIQQKPAFISQAIYFRYGLLEMAFQSSNWCSITGTLEQQVMLNIQAQSLEKERIAMLCYLNLAVTYQILNKPALVQTYLRKTAECRDDVQEYFKELLHILDLICHFESGDHFLVTRHIKNIHKKQIKKEESPSALLVELIRIFTASKADHRSRLAQEILAKIPEWKGTQLGFHLISYRVLLRLEAVAGGKTLVEYMDGK